jgi:hypothetical protein
VGFIQDGGLERLTSDPYMLTINIIVFKTNTFAFTVPREQSLVETFYLRLP